MKKLIRGLLIITAIMLLSATADAKTLTRYTTQTVTLRDSRTGDAVQKVKSNTKVKQVKGGKKFVTVKYKGERYKVRKIYLNAEKLPSKKKSRYYINYIKTKAPVKWHGRKYTYYTSRLCPIWLLPVKGLHLDKNGFWCDENDYIVLGSSRVNKANRTVFATPFGKYGKVYDTGSVSTPSWLCDTAVNW